MLLSWPTCSYSGGLPKGEGERERGREGLQQRRDSPQYDGAISSQRVIHDCAIAAPPTTGLGWMDCHRSENSSCSGAISVLRLEEKSNQNSRRRPYVALLPIGRITRAHTRARHGYKSPPRRRKLNFPFGERGLVRPCGARSRGKNEEGNPER